MDQGIRTVFFGGTFDPPHNGHLNSARKVLSSGIAEQVVFAPALHPPHKLDCPLSSFDDRLRMTERMIEGETGMSVTDEEKNSEGASYTIDTLDRLKRKHPDRHWILLIGGDSLATLHTWHRAEDLVDQYEICSFPRPGEDVSPEYLLRFWDPFRAERLSRTVIRGAEEDPSASTEIRRKIRAGIVPEELKPAVYQYIQNRRLYTMNEEPKRKNLSSKELAEFCAGVADEHKASDVIVMDLSELSAVAEIFVVCTGTSAPHLRAVSEWIQKSAKEQLGLKGKTDGTPESGWMITDFGNVMVHVFTEESRKLYQIETLWGDAPKIEAIRKLEAKAVSSRLK